MEVAVFEELDHLVEELGKDCPDESFVREKMFQLGIGYCRDPVERLNRVLMALHPVIESNSKISSVKQEIKWQKS